MKFGIYQRSDAYIDPETGIPAWDYLRFYEDRTVITTCTEGTLEDILKWPFDKENLNYQDHDRSEYKLNNDLIEFTFQMGRITISYKGKIQENSLYLDVHSTYKNYRATEVYSLVLEC